MITSNAGLELIKLYEGCRLTAYKCPAGVWTIGIGHTGTVNGVKISAGLKISEAKAEELLRSDLQRFESAVNALILPYCPLNQYQFDALVSFCFNIGITAFSRSTLVKLLTQKRYAEAAEQFKRWNKGGGKVLPGLVKRRSAEKALFLKK